MLSSKYGGAGSDSSINDSSPSLTTTYSGTKVDADNATQDAAIIAVDSELEYDSGQNNILIPAGVGNSGTPPSSLVSLVPNMPAGSLTPLGSIVSVFIGHNAIPTYADTSVLVGGIAGNGGTFQNGVVVGYDAAVGSSSNRTVVVGASAAKTSGAIDEAVIVGAQAGPSGSGTAEGCVILGGFLNDSSRNYTDTADITFPNFTVAIGGATSSGGQPLIYGSNDPLGRHWSPGAPADLGTATQRWEDAFFSSAATLQMGSTTTLNSGGLSANGTTVTSSGLAVGTTAVTSTGVDIGTASITESGATGMYDFAEFRQAVNQGSYPDASIQMVSFTTTDTASSLGHIVPVTSGTETYFRNDSGETRRWLVNWTVCADDNVFFLQTGLSLGTGPIGVITTPRRGQAAVQQNDASGGQNAILSSTAVVEVGAGQAVAIWAFGDTADGSNWLISGAGGQIESTLTITELPQ